MRYNLPAFKLKYFQYTLSKLEIWNRFTQTINLTLPRKSQGALLRSEANLRSIFDNTDTSYIFPGNQQYTDIIQNLPAAVYKCDSGGNMRNT